MKQTIVTKIKHYTINKKVYDNPTELTFKNTSFSVIPEEIVVCKGILINISIGLDKPRYIIVSKDNKLLVNHNQINELTLAEIKENKLKNGDKVYIQCQSMYELFGEFLPYPHNAESNHRFVIYLDTKNKTNIYKI